MMKSERGQALPLVLIAIMVGALVIPPFLGHAGTSLIGSRHYAESIDAQYAVDAGAEHAIWNLVYNGLTDNISSPDDYVTYELDEPINGLTTTVTVTNTDVSGNTVYEILAEAGDNSINAEVAFPGGNLTILSWSNG
jgi:hypothetical protein